MEVFFGDFVLKSIRLMRQTQKLIDYYVDLDLTKLPVSMFLLSVKQKPDINLGGF